MRSYGYRSSAPRESKGKAPNAARGQTRREATAGSGARIAEAAAIFDVPRCLECLTKLTPIIAGFRCPRCQRATLQLECGAREVLP